MKSVTLRLTDEEHHLLMSKARELKAPLQSILRLVFHERWDTLEPVKLVEAIPFEDHEVRLARSVSHHYDPQKDLIDNSPQAMKPIGFRM